MKVCVIGNYRERSGYSKACLEYILSMREVGIDVVSRHVTMTGREDVVDDSILELEKKDLNAVDAVIQFNLPSEYSFRSDIKNFGAFAYETDSLKNSPWKDSLKLLDAAIVPSRHQFDTLSEIGVKSYVVPYSVDTEKFVKDYDFMDFGLPNNCVKFYTIAEFGKRKDLPALIFSYYTAFTSDDNVALIIKTHVPNHNPDYARAIIKETAQDLRAGMRKGSEHKYPPIIILTQYLNEDKICSLHKSADIFVSTSHGESPCLPAIDALGFGNFCIVPDHGSFREYINHYENGILVKQVMSPVFGVVDSPPGLYTARERWSNVQVSNMAESMTFAVNNFKNSLNFGSNENKILRSNKILREYSREFVGNKLKEIINAD